MTTPAVSFVAKSGTGKTTLLEKVVAELKRREYKVGTVKHGAHHFDIDHPGKDSFRMAAAGADTVLITSKDKLALIRKHRVEPPLKELIEAHFTDMDIVLVEGFKQNDLPKVEVHRQDRRSTMLCRGEKYDSSLVAVASDEPLPIDVPVLDLNDPGQVADFIVKTFLSKMPRQVRARQ